MTPENLELDENFFAQFLDDYFAECDEHLTAVRHGLLALETQVGQSQLDRPLLDDLFRRFHSVKGLSGMVGVRAAEQLSHQMESLLRTLREGRVRLAREMLDALVAGAQLLEQTIAGRRNNKPPPAIEEIMARLTAAAHPVAEPARPTPPAPAIAALPTPPEAPTLTLTDRQRDQLATALAAAGARAWLFEFTPSSVLAERGINVNSVRGRLQEIGVLIHAMPSIHGQGGIAFEFLVVSAADEAGFAAWKADGLIWQPYQPAPPPAGAESALPPAVETPTMPTLTPSNLVRVDLARLDELMHLVGELVISRARLEDNLARLEPIVAAAEWRGLQEINLAMARQLRDLREGVMRVRMVPVGELFGRMQLAVYDLARGSGKQVRLALSGQDTEIDKYLVERMLDPLLHLVRNAVSHGLEAAETRAAIGKPAVGQVALRASTAGDAVVIEVEDDGRGVDTEKVAARGRALGLLTADAPLDAATLLDLLCAPGFSTRDEADLAAGRGVGMTAVRNTVQELGGSLSLDTQAGRGTRFTIQLPLTLAIADALIVSVSGQRFAVPLLAVREVLEVQPDAVRVLDGQAQDELLLHRGRALPLLRLARFFGLPCPAAHAPVALVAGSGLSAIGLIVDRVLDQREIVIRPLADPLVQSPGLAGATELGDGRVVLILDVGALTKVKYRR